MADHLGGEAPTGFWYLAGPYSGTPEEMEERTSLHQKASITLLRKGIFHYSPIASWHNPTKTHSLPTHAGFWRGMNFSFLHSARGVILLELEGWQESKGVQEELKEAFRLLLPVWGWWMEGDEWRELRPPGFLQTTPSRAASPVP